MTTNPNRFPQRQVIPLGRYKPDPNECPECHSMPGLIAGGCHRCQNTGRIRPSPKPDPVATRSIGMTFDDAYAAYPAGVMNDTTADWRVYVEPSAVPGRHDVFLQDKIHPAKPHRRVCVYHNCKYADIRLFLIHLTSCTPLDTLCSEQWRPRPF